MSSAQELRSGRDVDQDSDERGVLPPPVTAEDTASVTVMLAKTPDFGIQQPVKNDLVDERVGFHAEEGPITIGEALESTAAKIGDKPVTVSDARAIQSAEARATGLASGVKGGPASEALSAVDRQRRRDPSATTTDTTIGEVLADATFKLPVDKVATPEDAARVHSVESRNNDGHVARGGVTASLQSAATHNQNAGFLPGADGAT